MTGERPESPAVGTADRQHADWQLRREALARHVVAARKWDYEYWRRTHDAEKSKD